MTLSTSPTRAATKPPVPPSVYALPAAPVRVNSGWQLAAALAGSTPRDIVLVDGVYTAGTYFSNHYGHRLYAEHLGRAVLKVGLEITRAPAVVRGIAFDVSDPDKTLRNSIIHVWGNATNTKILDVTVNGNSAVDTGVYVRQPDGVVLKRIVAANLQGYGVLVDANVFDLRLTTPAVLEDIDVSRVSYPRPLSSNGTAEACIWVGNTVKANRLRVRDCAWMGLWTGTASNGSLFSNIDIDRSLYGVGLYVEHLTRNTTFQHMKIGPDLNTGVNCEWSNPHWGVPACGNIIIQDSVIDTTCVGVYLDEGTKSTTVRRTTFLNQRWAAIADYRGRGNLWDTSGIDTTKIAPSAVSITYQHFSASNCD